MRPEIWGKYMWISIHIIALGYPTHPTNDDKIQYKRYFENLHTIIPCYTCSQNYISHLADLPLLDTHLSSNKELFKWTVNLHNVVNKMLKKPIMNYEDAYILYADTLIKKNDIIKEAFRELSSRNYTLNRESMARRICIFMNILTIMICLYFAMKLKKS